MNDNTQKLIDRIRATSTRKEKAEVAGLKHERVKLDGTEMACETCIYYLPRFGWCDMPDLDIAVDPNWFCDLWRI